jgi:hypothetical protein
MLKRRIRTWLKHHLKSAVSGAIRPTSNRAAQTLERIRAYDCILPRSSAMLRPYPAGFPSTDGRAELKLAFIRSTRARNARYSICILSSVEFAPNKSEDYLLLAKSARRSYDGLGISVLVSLGEVVPGRNAVCQNAIKTLTVPPDRSSFE